MVEISKELLDWYRNRGLLACALAETLLSSVGDLEEFFRDRLENKGLFAGEPRCDLSEWLLFYNQPASYAQKLLHDLFGAEEGRKFWQWFKALRNPIGKTEDELKAAGKIIAFAFMPLTKERLDQLTHQLDEILEDQSSETELLSLQELSSSIQFLFWVILPCLLNNVCTPWELMKQVSSPEQAEHSVHLLVRLDRRCRDHWKIQRWVDELPHFRQDKVDTWAKAKPFRRPQEVTGVLYKTCALISKVTEGLGERMLVPDMARLFEVLSDPPPVAFYEQWIKFAPDYSSITRQVSNLRSSIKLPPHPEKSEIEAIRAFWG